MDKTPNNFCGLEGDNCSYKKAKAVIVPVPYEKTTTYLKGTNKAPKAVIEASKNMELYDEELDKVIADIGISTLPPLKTKSKPCDMIKKVKAHCAKVINDGKFPVVIGGEHSISVGFLLAIKEKYPNISVVQFDAHADLRDEYRGSKYNHACVMARMREQSDVIGVGIRSLSYKESRLIKDKNYKIIWAKDRMDAASCVRKILDSVKGDIYLTIDVDAFDPTLVPSVGTPEPGGFNWYDILAIAKGIFEERNVVGFDVMELCPNPVDKSADFIIAKLIYKLLGYKFFTRR